MERLRLWRSLTEEQKFATAQEKLKAHISCCLESDSEIDWQEFSIAELAPSEVARAVIEVVEEVLGLCWELEWDYDADAEDLHAVGYGATAYWFKVSDPETGFVLTHKCQGSTGERLRFYTMIETFTDIVKAVLQLADIIADKLPSVRNQFRPKEVS